MARTKISVKGVNRILGKRMWRTGVEVNNAEKKEQKQKPTCGSVTSPGPCFAFRPRFCIDQCYTKRNSKRPRETDHDSGDGGVAADPSSTCDEFKATFPSTCPYVTSWVPPSPKTWSRLARLSLPEASPIISPDPTIKKTLSGAM